jgi:hypothetical protein
MWVGDTGYETLVTAINNCGAQQCTLVIPEGNQQVLSNLIIPNNITLKVLQGGNIQIASNVTLTIQGGFMAGSYQVFTDKSGDLTKGIKFSHSCGLSYVRPEWWGAVGDSQTDCTPAINLAINSRDNSWNSFTVQFGAGVYICYETINVIKNTTFNGVSGGCSFLWDNTMLCLPHGAIGPLISGNKADNLSLQNLTFMPSDACSTKLIYLFGGGSGGTISGCYFYTTAYPTDGSSWAIYIDDHSQIQIMGNYFTGRGGVFVNGAGSQFCENEMGGGGTGPQAMALCIKTSSVIHSNIFFGWFAGITLSQCAGVNVFHNRFDQCTYGIRNLGQNSLVQGTNTFTSNRICNNVYHYVSDLSAPTATLDANNFLYASGSGSESVPAAAILAEGDGNTIQQNRFYKNDTNIGGLGKVQGSNNFGIDIPF